MAYQDRQGVVVYHSKLHATLKHNFKIMPVTWRRKLFLQPVSDQGEHLARYYGWYINCSRGERKTMESVSTLASSEQIVKSDSGVGQSARSADNKFTK